MTQENCTCPLTRGERILAAVDGSDFSDAAVDQAISLGEICKSRIFIISVVDLYPEQMAVAPALVEKMSSEVREHLDRAEQKVKEAGMSCETIVRFGGKPHELIVQEARERSVDLITMGTHGQTGLRRIFMGSVAQNVVGTSPCPVLVVPSMP